MNDPISAEQAHQVAMQAALTAGAIAQTNYTHPDQVGKVISDAYLQAYEAVEGWTKPQAPTVDTDADKASQFAPSYEMSTADPLHPHYQGRKSLHRADYFTNQAASLQLKDA